MVFGYSSLLSFTVGNALINLMYLGQRRNPFSVESYNEALVAGVAWLVLLSAVMLLIDAARRSWSAHREAAASR